MANLSDIRVTKAGKPVVSPYTNAIVQAYIVDASAPDGGPPIDLLPTPTPESFKLDVYEDLVSQHVGQQWTIARLTTNEFPAVDDIDEELLRKLLQNRSRLLTKVNLADLTGRHRTLVSDRMDRWAALGYLMFKSQRKGAQLTPLGIRFATQATQENSSTAH
jgi:hypothetical protein